MRVAKLIAVACVAVTLANLSATDAGAQLGDVLKKGQKKAEAKADKEIDKAMDSALEGKPKSDDKKKAAAAAPAAQSRGKPGEGVWLNYDFIPGARTLFFEDFSDDKVGNFPSRLEWVRGNMEVAEWEGQRWLRAPAQSDFEIPLPEMLPERFTVEFTYFTGGNSMAAMLRFAEKAAGKSYAEFRAHVSGLSGAGVSAQTRTDDLKISDKPFHCRLLVDGMYVKVFTNEVRTANVPKADLGRDNVIRVHIPGTTSNPVMLTDLRVAASTVEIYDALEADGRVVLPGILFATNSADLLPESTPTLEEIGDMMKKHPDIRIVIEGHTDNQGKPEYNQELSETRAGSVRAYLVDRHGIDGNRLTVKGFGETKPMDSNDTPQGRHNNRRVEVAMAG